jgi:SAM-dependent methyltransferase
MGLFGSGSARRAQRALERQLDYQQRRARRLAGREARWLPQMQERSREVRAKIDAFRPVDERDRVLEVGSGAHGLIFFFGTESGVGVDPLADEYASLFPAWQSRARTIAAGGENLPFGQASFDIVLCDNVVDHAESPRRIVEEMARVLRPGGILYFTVNVHHPVYHLVGTAHAAWRAVGVPLEITPFADHTVHLTPRAARRLFDGLPFRTLAEGDNVAEVRRFGSKVPPRHVGDWVKRLFYKNAKYELIAERVG